MPADDDGGFFEASRGQHGAHTGTGSVMLLLLLNGHDGGSVCTSTPAAAAAGTRPGGGGGVGMCSEGGRWLHWRGVRGSRQGPAWRGEAPSRGGGPLAVLQVPTSEAVVSSVVRRRPTSRRGRAIGSKGHEALASRDEECSSSSSGSSSTRGACKLPAAREEVVPQGLLGAAQGHSPLLPSGVCCRQSPLVSLRLDPLEPRDPLVNETMAAEVEAHKLLVRRCVDDLKKLDGASRYQVATFIPPMQKIGDLYLKLLRLPKSLCEDVADVMAQQGAAELLAQALTSLSDKDSPVPDANFRPIYGTVGVLLNYTDLSPALGRAVGQCGTIKHLLDILKHQPLWERSKTEPAIRRLLVRTVTLLANLSRVPENRACFRQSNAVPVMQELLKKDDADVRMSALQVIAHVLEESDCDPLGETNSTNELLQAISRPNVYGRYKRVGVIIYLGEELLESLAMLSVCWPVRRKIYEAGAVAPLVQSLRQGRSAEKLHAVTTLSRLSRDPGTCSQMRQVTPPPPVPQVVLRAVKGFISCCSSSRSTEVQARLAGVPKWQEGDVQAWLEESSLGAYGPNFTQIDGRILHSLLEIRQQAPEFFAMVAREVGGFHRLEDFLKFLDAVEKLH
ncbi:unnamed protein product [Lampetra planeri]